MTEPVQTLDAPVDSPPAAAAPPVEPAAPASPALRIIRRGDDVVEPAATPADPSPAAPVTPAAAPAPADIPAPAADPIIDEEEVDFFDYAATQTGGAIKTADDVFNIYKENAQLKKQIAEKPKIEFPNEQSKWLYEQATKFPGVEKETFRSMLHVLSLDVTKLSDKEKQFEAFALENKKLTREQARGYFEARYEKNFGNGILETDQIAQYDHMRETDKATDTLARMQEEFSKIEPSKPAAQAAPQIAPEELDAIRKDASNVLSRFGGMTYQFVDNDPSSSVNIPLEDADIPVLENYMTNPATFFEDLTNECRDEEGNFSMESLAMAMFEFKNRERIREQAYATGRTHGKLEQIKLQKNTSSPAPTPTPAPAAPAKTYEQTMAEAIRASKAKR